MLYFCGNSFQNAFEVLKELKFTSYIDAFSFSKMVSENVQRNRKFGLTTTNNYYNTFTMISLRYTEVKHLVARGHRKQENSKELSKQL